MDLARCLTAAFVAGYPGAYLAPVSGFLLIIAPDMEEVKIMLPPCPSRFITFAPYLPVRSIPVRLIPMILFQSSMEISEPLLTPPAIPALLNRISSVPNSLTASSMNVSIDSSSATSPVRGTAFIPNLVSRYPAYPVSCVSRDEISISATSAPNSAKAWAQLRPIPPAAPVTRAFFPFSPNMSLTLPSCSIFNEL